MIYTFKCDWCQVKSEFGGSISVGPPEIVECPGCHKTMQRDYKADMPHIDTSLCKDHNDIPADKRVYRPNAPKDLEARFQRDIEQKRKLAREAKKSGSSLKMTRSVPADLYHGKIRETGDKKYWDDPKNLRKHKETEI